MSTVKYSAGQIEIDLGSQHSVGLSAFRAKSDDYLKQLKERASIPTGLKILIARLFERQVITACSISFGTKMVLKLSRQSSKGNLLLIDGALEQFANTYSEITGKQLDVTWEESSGPRRGRNKSSDYSRAVGVLVNIIDAVMEATIFAAAVDQLFDDD